MVAVAVAVVVVVVVVVVEVVVVAVVVAVAAGAQRLSGSYSKYSCLYFAIDNILQLLVFFPL